MVRRRPASVIGAFCLAVALSTGAPAGVGAVGPGARVVVTEAPVLSELPPLPDTGEATDPGDEAGESDRSGVQLAALALAVVAFVAGGAGLAVVTRRGRAEAPGEQPHRTGPVH